MEPTFFVHLTDIHISAPGKKPLFGLDTTAKLQAVFEGIRNLRMKPAFIAISGDLTHDGDLADYRHLKTLLAAAEQSLGLPIHVALGNHDFREPFREGYLGEEPSDESYYYSFMAEGGLRMVMLNTQVPGTHSGRIDEAQLAWLDEVLTEPAPTGTIIVHHHPLVPTPTAVMDDHLLTNPQDLTRVLEGRDVIGLLSGHIHFHNIGILNGIPCAAADGVAFGLDPSAAEHMRFIDRSGFNLVIVKDGQMIVQPMTMPGDQRVLYEWNLSKAHAEA